ncbi:GGDEF domain-containing protein [Fusibacter paucivorans]|uniref:GGDEF domain-containing protein n=1 Tax=Fusibacter paucivorans TaxID=76009 RepID=A0ABS5PT58_9FIRM|nr:GGDEF domain-containing protein [Fusibacter paucivorans]MBS7528343.1 GGDEF domain-containing protein [Fusibacter paucivorans]
MFHVANIVYADLLIFCVVLNSILYIFLTRQQSPHSFSTRLFRQMIAAVTFVALCEMIAWLAAVPNSQSLMPLHYFSNALFLVFNTLPVAFGLRYLDYKIFLSKKKSFQHFWGYLTPVYLNFGFMIYNCFHNGFLFSVDAANQYHRGFATYIGNGVAFGVTVIAVFFFFQYKIMITGRITQAILSLTFLPVIGAIIQMLFYGLSLGIPSYTLALFISFLLLERDEQFRDPLTTLNSRAQMERRLQFKLKSRDAFTSIIVDVNNFKHINDFHGHTTGDAVLKEIAGILVSETNLEDFVCRYGGDEFFIILETAKDIGADYIQKIEKRLASHFETHPYEITLSYGLLYVDNVTAYAVEDIIRIADLRMYEDKRRRKQLSL